VLTVSSWASYSSATTFCIFSHQIYLLNFRRHVAQSPLFFLPHNAMYFMCYHFQFIKYSHKGYSKIYVHRLKFMHSHIYVSGHMHQCLLTETNKTTINPPKLNNEVHNQACIICHKSRGNKHIIWYPIATLSKTKNCYMIQNSTIFFIEVAIIITKKCSVGIQTSIYGFASEL
jgi:hypothetical protein